MFDIVFYIFAIGLCVSAVLTVTAQDIFHSAVWLSFALLNIGGIYFLLDSPFLGVIQVLVYIGGIISLFVFAIKLTASIGDKKIQQVNEQGFWAGVVSLALFALLFYLIRSSTWASTVSLAQPISLKELGRSLMTTYVLPFEFLSVILLAAMIGSIIIGKVKK